MDNKGHHVKNEKMCAREVGNNFQKVQLELCTFQ